MLVRVYGPYGGTFKRAEVNGKDVLEFLNVVELEGRPVATFAVHLSGKPVDVEWLLASGAGQTGPAELWMTPSIVAGSGVASQVPSVC